MVSWRNPLGPNMVLHREVRDKSFGHDPCQKLRPAPNVYHLSSPAIGGEMKGQTPGRLMCRRRQCHDLSVVFCQVCVRTQMKLGGQLCSLIFDVVEVPSSNRRRALVGDCERCQECTRRTVREACKRYRDAECGCWSQPKPQDRASPDQTQ